VRIGTHGSRPTRRRGRRRGGRGMSSYGEPEITSTPCPACGLSRGIHRRSAARRARAAVIPALLSMRQGAGRPAGLLRSAAALEAPHGGCSFLPACSIIVVINARPEAHRRQSEAAAAGNNMPRERRSFASGDKKARRPKRGLHGLGLPGLSPLAIRARPFDCGAMIAQGRVGGYPATGAGGDSGEL
jgi:hypothetical protein